jgi:preprotein translocase subunit SecE
MKWSDYVFFTNRKLIKRTAVVVSAVIIMALVIGTIAPYMM